MLNKQYQYVQRQWVRGNMNLTKIARHFGYKGSALQKGIIKVKTMIHNMHLPVME